MQQVERFSFLDELLWLGDKLLYSGPTLSSGQRILTASEKRIEEVVSELHRDNVLSRRFEASCLEAIPGFSDCS